MAPSFGRATPASVAPSYDDLVARVKALEQRSISVADLPLAALRKTLLTEQPADPAEVLLPGSIGTGMLGTHAATSDKVSLTTKELAATSNLTVGTAAATVPGLTWIVSEGGKWLVLVTLDVLCTTSGGTFTAGLYTNGTAEPDDLLEASSASSQRVPATHHWVADLTAGDTVSVQAARIGGGYTVEATHSVLTAVRIA